MHRLVQSHALGLCKWKAHYTGKMLSTGMSTALTGVVTIHPILPLLARTARPDDPASMRRWSFSQRSDPSSSLASPANPWNGSARVSDPPRAGEPSPQVPRTSSISRRLFGRDSVHSSNVTAPSTPPTPVEQLPIRPPFISNSVALRLSKRAAILDKRLNVHVRNSSQPLTAHDARMPPLPELEGTAPALRELEGDRPMPAELEGSTPMGTLTAVPARVIPAGAVKRVKVKAKRASSRHFPGFRPETTQYSVECSNAADDVARAEREAKDKRFFIEQINACRRVQGVRPLVVDDELSTHAQHYADNMPSHEDSIITPPGSPGLYFLPTSPIAPRPDTVTSVASPLDRRSTCARIISDGGLGAMACVERWYSGKHRRHPHGIVSPERHQEDCPRRLEIVYDTIMDAHFSKIGVGRATEVGSGEWVVELAA